MWREIVGVARDVKNFGVTRGSLNAMYLPYSQVASPCMTMVMRTSVDPASLIPTARSVVGVSATDPTTFGATVVLLGVVAAAASAIPAQRAVGVDPITVLKDE